MIFLIIIIILSIVGIIFTYLGNLDWRYDTFLFLGMLLDIFTGLTLLIMGMVILFKPYDYKQFKIEYETVQAMITTSEDVRDTNYTQKLIEINTEINTNKEFINNPWIGLFYNKQIAELELLNKE